MEKQSRLLKFFLAAIAVCITLYCAFYFIFLDIIVDFWWFRSMDYGGYFWLRLLYRYLILGGVTLLFFGIFFLHFWIASRFLDNYDAFTEGGGEKISQWKRLFQLTSIKVYTPISLLLAIIIALPFYQQWDSALLYFFSSDAGIADPIYHWDISFYLFSLPIYQLVQGELLTTAILLFLFIALMYWVKHHHLSDSKPAYPLASKMHLTILVLFVCLFVAWGFMLQRYNLLYTDVHEPGFFGPGYVEIRYHLPLIWAALITFLCTAVTVLLLIYSNGETGKKTLIGLSVFFLIVVGLRHAAFLPSLIKQFIVEPNPVKAEQPFMQFNIDATLAAYNLNQINTLDFSVSLNPGQDISKINPQHLKNIPLWDRELLDDVYKQLQGIRPYYNFPKVNEDRYLIDDYVQQVNLGAREININKLPEEARNWENTHLRYTHGYGAVVTPAAQAGDQPMEWYMRDLNLESSIGLKIDNPDVYYGMEYYPYAIVPNELEVLGVASTTADDNGHHGKGGIPIRSLFRKLLFAFYFTDEKIFFSTNINQDSKMRIHRNVIERLDRLAPYLAMDGDPYLTVTSKGLYWIQDAYTTSNWYPVSKPSTARFRTGAEEKLVDFNYIRNSVKIIVSAYDGSADFYIVDPEDPIIQAYNRAYPGFFKTLADMPAELTPHLRYPREIFHHQMRIYAKYHQTEPALFYQQAETWEFAELDATAMKPYYLTTDLQGCSEMEKFVLVVPMTPIGRDNLSSLGIAGSLNLDACSLGYSPKITLFKFRKDVQVDGPAQISARIDQDPVISEQFTLWDQRGSEVKRGRMILLPVGHSILYVQPVYIVSTNVKIPELKRVIVSMGNQVVMDRSLQLAFQQLESKINSRSGL